MSGKKIRVLVVDDSMFFRAAIIKAFTSQSDFEVVGEAYDPYDARDKILDLEPDVMTLDVEMPYMNGLEFLKVLLPQWPIPVIVVSSARQYEQECLREGARDFVPKPQSRSSESFSEFSNDLIARIRHMMGSRDPEKYVPTVAASSAARASGDYAFKGIIALGASTGGTQSTAKILRALPGDLPGIVVVQHMPPDFTRMYAENLDRDCQLTINEAKDGDLVQKGHVLIAPGGDQHMELQKRGTQYYVRLVRGEKVNGHCPSVDTLFFSTAKVAGADAVGIILTGMGADGARGLCEMRRKGAFTIGQDEKTSVVYGMPKEAYDMGGVCRQAPLENIASILLGFVRDMRR